jgi:hypothetical protein
MVGFPLLLIPLAVYNIIVFLMPGVSFTDPLVKLTLMSGAEWPLTLSDVLLALGILLLMFEVIKGARPGAKYLTDHLLSLIVFGAAAAEFVLWPKFGTSTYFLLAALSLADFISGLALRARRGAVAVTASAVPKKNAATPVVEPAHDAAPAPAPSELAPSAPAPIAETVERPDHPEPPTAQSPVNPPAASPEVPSPGLQPGSGTPPSPDTPQR